MQLCNYDFIICHPGYHDAVPFAYIKTTSHQALKTRHRCLLGYNHRKFSFGGTSGSTREKPVLVVQLTAWPWILSKQPVSSTIQLHMQKVSDGVAHCVDFKSTWQRPRLKSESQLHLLWRTSIALRKLALVKQSTPLYRRIHVVSFLLIS